jgi:hypothetical protein
MTKAAPGLRALKGLIWLYLIILIFEGALRKWVLPSLANPLLIVRDPLVMLIYVVALSNKRFPVNGFVLADVFLAMAAFIGGLLSPYSNILVALIGLRCYFLHLPLIFVMERTLNRDDVFRLGKFLLWVSVPITVLVVAQFYAPQSNWVNLDVGGGITTGMPGADNRFRPSGTFSFTTGVGEFYPLVLAILLGFLLSQRRLWLILSVAAGLSVVIAVPFSINRTNAMTCAFILVTGGVSLFFLVKPPVLVARSILVVGAIALILSQLSFFQEGVSTFSDRWTSSTGTSKEGFRDAIVYRALDDVTPPLDYIFDSDSLTGFGVGFGTSMASGLLTGQRSFSLGESEWPRLLLEMGPVLGVVFIGLRIALCGRLIMACLGALRRNNVVPILLGVEAVLLTLNSQWSQPTTLGFSTFIAGLTFAAARLPVDPATLAPPPRQIEARWSPRPSQNWKPLGTPLPGPEEPSPLAGSTS